MLPSSIRTRMFDCARLRRSTSAASVTRVGAVGALVLAASSTSGAGDARFVPELVAIPAGAFIEGSDESEREAAYRLDERAYGHTVTREQRWYANERPRKAVTTGAYRITVTPVTNRQYADFVAATGHRAPGVDPATWASYGLILPHSLVERHAWRDGRPPVGREEHPVVLVSQADAMAYARWLTAVTNRRWRLPTERDWEKAARGVDGRRFPWGDEFDSHRLNSHDAGPYDTTPVGRYPLGASTFGLLDAAGLVFEWTSTADGPGRALVKGGS